MIFVSELGKFNQFHQEWWIMCILYSILCNDHAVKYWLTDSKRRNGEMIKQNVHDWNLTKLTLWNFLTSIDIDES